MEETRGGVSGGVIPPLSSPLKTQALALRETGEAYILCVDGRLQTALCSPEEGTGRRLALQEAEGRRRGKIRKRMLPKLYCNAFRLL